MSKFTKRGVMLPFLKEPAASRPILDIAAPAKIFMPLISGDGSICQPKSRVYDTVLRGDILALPTAKGGCPVYSPVTGLLNAVQEMTHPLLGNVSCAVIDCMVSGGGKSKEKPVNHLNREAILALCFQMGIVDELDGALLAGKLASLGKSGGVLLVADGSEQEPYSSSAWSVLKESAPQVLAGLELAARAVGTEDFHIAVKLNRHRLKELEAQIEKGRLFEVAGRYPAEVTHEANENRICRIGIQACLALFRAAAFEEPPCDCVITVAGDAVANPQNVRVPFGTKVEDVLRFCGLASDPVNVILGDAMTGAAIQRDDIPIIPGITCLLAIKTRIQPPACTCIGCGRCMHACHANLLPYEIMRRLDNMQYERLASLLPENCDGCGACSHVCPAGLDVTAKVLEARDAQGNIFMKWGDGDDL